jgi:hypothetical protein
MVGWLGSPPWINVKTKEKKTVADHLNRRTFQQGDCFPSTCDFSSKNHDFLPKNRPIFPYDFFMIYHFLDQIAIYCDFDDFCKLFLNNTNY